MVQTSRVFHELHFLESQDIDDDSSLSHFRREPFEAYVRTLIDMGKCSHNFCQQIIKLYIQRYKEAANVFDKEIVLNKGNAKVLANSYGLIVIALLVIAEDIKAAEAALARHGTEIPNYLGHRDFEVSEQLIDFWNEGRQEDWDNLVIKPSISGIYPTNIIKLLRTKKVNPKPVIKKVEMLNLDDDAGFAPVPPVAGGNNEPAPPHNPEDDSVLQRDFGPQIDFCLSIYMLDCYYVYGPDKINPSH
eukprot:TRINITY_DN2961_c0_g1_i5.p1 TRINITY_DN2961_c0_g1~~TRINITY_DN2961_c0_g1_i5.p1  ORF type:complete len:246 (+),score=31.06 TRINITY_DN2961_c0_g1_i5:254-991(+)